MKNPSHSKPELIAPAGDLEKLKIAFQYGADAVYASTPKFSMRTREIGFTPETLTEGIEYAHALGKKVYLTLNIFPHSTQIPDVLEHADNTASLKPDAIIVADPGIFHYLKENHDIPLHLSTQANTTNYLTANFWQNLGADRVVLAREMSMEDIKKTSEHTDIHLECFVHGSMCMAYSGRCQLSNYMAARDPNQGACVQACRFKYKLYGLKEELRSDEVYPIFEDDHGSYIFNSKDLCMINYIPELIAAGVDSFKIEGRLKSQYYVASVVRAYRHAIDLYFKDADLYKQSADDLYEEVRKMSNRGFTTGFYFQKPTQEINNYETTRAYSDYMYAGLITGYNPEGKTVQMTVRNHLDWSQSGSLPIEIITPAEVISHTIKEVTIKDSTANEVHPNDKVSFTLSVPVPPNSFIRAKKV